MLICTTPNPVVLPRQLPVQNKSKYMVYLDEAVIDLGAVKNRFGPKADLIRYLRRRPRQL